jgi:nucleoside-diphosphate-sugar epimerase
LPEIADWELDDGMEEDNFMIAKEDLILVTGATGYIGSRVVDSLLQRGFQHIRCFVRPSSTESSVKRLSRGILGSTRIEVVKGNLLSPENCAAAVQGAAVIIHLAAGTGTKSFPDAYLNSVVTTRNLLEATRREKSVKRFVNVSSFAVYRNRENPAGKMVDERSPIETDPEIRGNAYCYAKVRQDQMVAEYAKRYGISYVIVRPGYVYGGGRATIPSRVGISTFGIFVHLGGPNPVPLTYIDNCAEAIALAGVRKLENEGEVFNIIDDDLPSSRRFLRLYKRKVKPFRSIYLPHAASYGLCWLWEWYSKRSEGQLAPVFNRSVWHAQWKKARYSNAKLKKQLGWVPAVPTAEALNRYFESCRSGNQYD